MLPVQDPCRNEGWLRLGVAVQFLEIGPASEQLQITRIKVIIICEAQAISKHLNLESFVALTGSINEYDDGGREPQVY